jgi:hypothetical protein
MRLTIAAAALVALSLSSALSPAAAAINELGIDISLAGNTHAEVQAYLATLNPDTRKAVLDGSSVALRAGAVDLPFVDRASAGESEAQPCRSVPHAEVCGPRRGDC